MVGQLPIAALLIAFTTACGGHTSPRRVEQPTLGTVDAAPSGAEAKLGEGAAKGFLRPCQTMIIGSGLVELRCDDYQVVEFRRPDSKGRADADLDDLMIVLRARFGELRDADELRLGAVHGEEALERLLSRALTAASPDELFGPAQD